MVVSSKHLMLASPVFKAMLSHGKFKEGRELELNGRAVVSLDDDDFAGFKILLHIIHGRNRLVPRTVNLHLLKNIAILVDKYQMIKAAESYSELWINAFIGSNVPVPKRYATLKQKAEVHIWIASSGLPIPDKIIDAIIRKRKEAIAGLHQLINTKFEYLRKFSTCTRPDDKKLQSACNTMLLGSLIRTTQEPSLYLGISRFGGGGSCQTLADVARQIEVSALCDEIKPWHLYYSSTSAETLGHGITTQLRQGIQQLDLRVSGLTMSQFQSQKKLLRQA